jgi:transcriptional regulator with GAF, ATPase, and Fis domain
LARRDREEAVTVLEQMAARLPRDLREVFWNDARRRELRKAVQAGAGYAPTELVPLMPLVSNRSSGTSTISELTSTPLESHLARILEINHELLGELDLQALTSKITEYALELLGADRGYVILREHDGRLSAHTSKSRKTSEEHVDFSRSIARQVMASRKAVVTMNASGDTRMQGYESVHQLMLEAIACVPIIARSGKPIGALYIEAKQRPSRVFERQMPMLQAFADQVGLALETARLVEENKKRANELAAANEDLQAAQARLRELLGERTLKLKRARQRLRDAHDTLYGHFGYQGIVGTSAVMRKMYALIDRVKDTEVPMLITGESGTGKEVAARAIHRASNRNKKPFLGVNCGAIPEHLLESELFGSTRGAFTGADRERKGLIREAEGGTVLLDEIGEMPHKMQAALLRVLQEREVRPVGGSREEKVDVRFIFATHRDLEELVQRGEFREDLYYRIHVVEMRIPPLRERSDDIPALVDHFFGIFAAKYRREKKNLTREALRRLMQHDFPGNVRQLEHVLLNAWILSEGEEILPEDLDLPERGWPSERPLPTSAPPPVSNESAPESQRPLRPKSGQTLSKHRRDEKERILQALQECNWNRVKAAEISGIPRRTFYRRLREYKIQ